MADHEKDDERQRRDDNFIAALFGGAIIAGLVALALGESLLTAAAIAGVVVGIAGPLLNLGWDYLELRRSRRLRESSSTNDEKMP